MASPSSLLLPTIQVTEVDGVPVVWCEGPGDPIRAAVPADRVVRGTFSRDYFES